MSLLELAGRVRQLKKINSLGQYDFENPILSKKTFVQFYYKTIFGEGFLKPTGNMIIYKWKQIISFAKGYVAYFTYYFLSTWKRVSPLFTKFQRYDRH